MIRGASKRRSQRQREAELIKRAAAAGGRLWPVKIDGCRKYAFRAEDWSEETAPVICETLQQAEHFIEIDEFTNGEG